MPSNVLKGIAKKSGKSEDELEKLWDKAKEAAKEEYPDVDEESDQFYKIVTGILKKMAGVNESFDEIMNREFANLAKLDEEKKKYKEEDEEEDDEDEEDEKDKKKMKKSKDDEEVDDEDEDKESMKEAERDVVDWDAVKEAAKEIAKEVHGEVDKKKLDGILTNAKKHKPDSTEAAIEIVQDMLNK